MSYDSPMILNPAGGGSWTLSQLTGQYAASTVRAGTTAFTTDAGQVISNGSSWVLQNPSAALMVGRKRVALFGDSHLAMGYRDVNCATTVGQFVVSGGIATITTGSTGTNFFGVGNYVSLQTLGDPNFTLALNGACTPILTKISSTAFTISATYGGVTMTDGDYSNPLASGQAWTTYSVTSRSDSSLFNWMRMFNNDPFDVTAIYSMTNQLGTVLPYQVAKSAYGPAFDVAVISVGTNDMQTGTTTAATAACYKVFYTLQQAVATLQARGKQVIVQLPIPDANANGSTKPKAAAEGVFRKLVSVWAGRNNVLVIDAYAQMLDGTVITGAAISAWSGGTHMNTVGMYNVSKIGSISQVMTQNPYNIDYEPVGLIEDNQTYAQTATAWAGSTVYAAGAAVLNGQNNYYCVTGGTSTSSGGPTGTGATITDGTVTWAYAGPNSVNIVAHPCMDGSGGGNTTALTGTVPASWSLLKSGSPTGTTTVQTRPTIPASTQAANWGKEWYVACTFSAGGEYIQCYQDIYSQMVSGNWYQFGITLRAGTGGWLARVAGIEFALLDGINPWAGTTGYTVGTRISNNSNVYTCTTTGTSAGSGGPTGTSSGIVDGTCVWAYFGPTTNFRPQGMFGGANLTTYPLLANDVLQLKSEPFYYQNNGTTSNAFSMKIISNSAGAVEFGVSSAWCRVVQNPNI